ncbi:MAG: glycosyltransferase [Patescibacteria group bacterium]|nr:glycosyltransferase [Patescibacteria group bacterium]MDD5164120.1 glycosyltransferase [Patescibacteria group bacterium]MDD5534222.1 glycosyltransferase [Patescibacteria group bacterium]
MFIEFCLPIYNEEKILKNNILKLLNYCNSQNFNFDWQIIILNNGSTDNSEKILRELNKEYPQKIKIDNIQQPGKGRAIKLYCLKSQADIIVYMDIDLAVSLKNIPDLIDPIIKERYDLVVGSRLLSTSKIERSFIRSLSSKVYNWLSKILFNHNLSDLQCGFKAIKADIFKKIIPYINDNKWFFDTELIIFTKYFGYKIKEIPVDWQENRYDQRKTKVRLLKDSFNFILNLVKLKMRLYKGF